MVLDLVWGSRSQRRDKRTSIHQRWATCDQAISGVRKCDNQTMPRHQGRRNHGAGTRWTTGQHFYHETRTKERGYVLGGNNHESSRPKEASNGEKQKIREVNTSKIRSQEMGGGIQSHTTETGENEDSNKAEDMVEMELFLDP